jgi:hypothetical protein
MEIGKIKVSVEKDSIIIQHNDGTIVFEEVNMEPFNIAKAICKAYELGGNDSPYRPSNRYKILDK